jgi:3-deoxy-D-manno-octulosonate 8-phosphate phosphatase (KDO 8-P phosphatase)
MIGETDIPVCSGTDRNVGAADQTKKRQTEDRMADESLPERCGRIELLVLDVDGVLTDGRIIYSDAGAELKAFHVRDGSGLKLWTQEGKKAGIITGRNSPIVERRAKELGIATLIQGADNKRAALVQMLDDLRLTPKQACAVGDDILDLPMLRACGLAATVADACQEAKEEADFVTAARGGHGAVREVIEWILRGQGRWEAIVARYRNQ